MVLKCTIQVVTLVICLTIVSDNLILVFFVGIFMERENQSDLFEENLSPTNFSQVFKSLILLQNLVSSHTL